MYSKRATSTSRRVGQLRRQTSSAFSDLKKLSMADLAIGLEPMALTGSIATIAFPAHRWRQPVLAQKLLVVVGTILRPAVCGLNAAWGRPADRDRHVQGPQSQILLQSVADRPADHAPRKQVKDYSETDPALAGPDIGDVACPLLVRPARSEVLSPEIRRDVEPMIAVRRALEFAAAGDLDAVQAQ